MNEPAATATVTRPERRTPSGDRIDAGLLRGFLKRALADDAVADPVSDLLFEHVVGGRLDRSVVATELSRLLDEAHLAATHEDWQAVADDLIAEAREIEDAPPITSPPITSLRFIDRHRQGYAGPTPIPEAGAFDIGSYLDGGGVDEDGEFTVTLVELMHGRGPALRPHLEAFGDGEGALRQAIEAGILDALGPVDSREEFSRRLLAMGMVDDSDEPLPGDGGAEA